MVDGLLHGVPQLVVPGKVFERKYNAKSIAEHHAGLIIGEHEFTAETIRNKAKKIMEEDTMIASARKLGRKLEKAGGADKIVREIHRGCSLGSYGMIKHYCSDNRNLLFLYCLYYSDKKV